MNDDDRFEPYAYDDAEFARLQKQEADERKKREAALRNSTSAQPPQPVAPQQVAQQQGLPSFGGMGGFNPSMMGASPTAEAGAAPAEGVSSGGMTSYWPLAVAAVVLAHNQWAKKKGLHDNVDAIDGRAFYKDADYYQQRGNEKLGGLGDEVKLASLGSSPLDLFKKDTWSQAARLAVQGGIVGNALRKIF